MPVCQYSPFSISTYLNRLDSAVFDQPNLNAFIMLNCKDFYVFVEGCVHGAKVNIDDV